MTLRNINGFIWYLVYRNSFANSSGAPLFELFDAVKHSLRRRSSCFRGLLIITSTLNEYKNISLMKRDSISAYPALRGEKTLCATFRLFCRPLKNSIAFLSRRGSVFFWSGGLCHNYWEPYQSSAGRRGEMPGEIAPWSCFLWLYSFFGVPTLTQARKMIQR